MIRKLLLSARSLFLLFPNSSKEKSFTLSLRLICLGMFFVFSAANALTRYSVANGNWNSTSTWATSSGGTAGASVPVAGDVVIIERGFTVHITANAACTTLQVGSPNNSNFGAIDFTGAFSLTVSGNSTFGGYGNTARTGTITFSSGSILNTGSLTIGNSNGTPAAGIINMSAGGNLNVGGTITVYTVSGNTWTPGAGTVNMTATNTLPSTLLTSFNNLMISSGTTTMGTGLTINGNLDISGTGLTTANNSLAIAGNFTSTGTFTPGTATVTLNGANQSFNVPNFYALTLSGSGTKTFASTGATAITNALTINSGIIANLGTQTHTANTLTLGSSQSLPGSWGSSSSAATNKSDAYFAATTGQINVSSSTCANFSTVLQITNVSLNTLSKTSSGTTGYEDFTADTPTTITQGKGYSLTVRGNTGGDQNVYYSAFFDWNNDGDFDDSGEYYQIGTIRNSTGTTGAASVYITVPSVATGNIKMRIIGRLTGYNNTPCAISGSSGQMEDYKVTVQSGCTGTAGAPVSTVSTVCPNVPFTISLPSSTLSDGATYVWQTSPDNATWSNATPAPITFFGTEAFNSLPANTNVYGSASVTGNQLLLTPATNSLSGAWVIQTTPGTNMDAFTVNFDYQASGGTGADGFSLSYAGDITSDAAGGESGQGSGIIVQFDTYDNEGVATGSRVRVLYAGNVLFNSAIDVPPLRPTTGNTPVVLTVDSKGKLTLRINGSIVVSDLSLPAGYLSANKSTWKYKFAARTGGSNDNHIIDNLLIRYQDITNSNSTFSTTQTAKTYYRVQVTCGTTTTTTSVLVDMSTAAITTQPTAPAAVCSGSGVSTISVAASGSGLTYSWRLGGVAVTNGGVISGQGTNTLTLTNPTAANAGSYTVVVGDACSTSVTSNAVTVTVNPTPTLTGASQAATVCAGSSATINLTGLLASSTSTVSYTINGTAQTPVTGVTASAGGAASFTTPALTAANNGQTLQITGITTTSSTPNCSQSFTTNVTLAVNPTPTLSGASQAAAVCAGSSATINLTGLRASSTSTVSYTINGTAQTPITGLTTTPAGTASFTTPALTAANNGQTLQITGITTTSSTPNCSQSFTTNVILAVNPTPTLTGATQAANVCVGSSATINLTGLLASSTSTVSYTINGTAQTPITGVTATAGGAASFTTPVLTAANNGQTLQITGITTTSSTPNCSQSFTTNVTLSVNPTPTLTGATQAAAVCAGSSATINLTGLLASSTSTVSYTINGAAQTPVTGVTATAGGAASFTSAALTAANNGQTLQITGITTTSSTPNCSQSFTTNVTLAVNPTPTLTGASQAANVCVGSSATINLTGLRASSTSTVSYTINGVAQTPVTGVTATAGGAASFTTPALTAANNGQTLQITGITTTSSTPNCSQSFTINVTLGVNPTPTLTGASQAANVCVGSSATINLTGLLASSTSTVSYTINGTAQTPVTGVTATAGGAASFTTPALTAANNGQTLQITGITTTSSTPNCSQSFTTNVTLAVNPTPTLTGATQAAAVCAGSSATINLTGLLASSTSTVSYTINGVAQTPVTGVTATAGGAASFTSAALTAANNGQTLQITGITTTSSTPNCTQSFTTNVTLAVNPTPTLTGASQAANVCVGSSATINLTGLRASSTSTVSYTINGVAQTPVTGVTATAGGAASFTTPALTAANNGQTLQITGITTTSSTPNCSQSFTINVTLGVNPTPTLTGATQAANVCVGSSATINLTGLRASSTSTISYTINGTAQTPVTGVTATAGGAASFTTPALTVTNNGQTLQITGITTTSSTPNCSQSFTINVTLAVNPTPTLTGATQAAAVCAGSSATINLTGLLASSTSTVSYTINGAAQTPVTGVTATAGGAASFATPALTAANNGQTLQITGITTTSSTPNCSQSFTTNVTLAVNALPVITTHPQNIAVCEGKTHTFTVVTSAGSPTYQWQYSPDNATWTNTNGAPGASGHTTASLSVSNIALSYSGYYVHCIITVGTCSSISNSALLTVNPTPTAPTASVTTQPTCAVPTATLTVSSPAPAAGITYSIDGTTYTNTTGIFSGLAAGPYNVTTKNSSGCESPITVVTVNPYVGKTWNGSVSTNWNTAGNWTPNGVPTSADCVVIPDLTSITNKPQITGTNSVFQGYTLNLNNNSSLTVQGTNTLTITNAVTVNTGSTLTFENNASLVQVNNVANSGNIIYKRDTQLVRRYDFTYWSTPVTATPAFTLHDLSPTTLADKYYSYNPNTGWTIDYNGSLAMVSGQGYIVRAPQEFDINTTAIYSATFTGVPNNGDITVTPVATKWNLIGNPYPSTIDADVLINNAGVGALYFWTHNSPPNGSVVGDAKYNYTAADYAVYTLTGSTGTASGAAVMLGKIAAGQGFFFKASTGSNVVFTNSMRVAGNNSQFFKTAETKDLEKNRVWLNFSNAEGLFKQALIGYIDGATNTWDQNYDAATLNGNTYADFYSINDAKKLTVQGRATPFEDTDVIPLGYRTAIAGEFTIAIDHTDGLLNDQKIYLEDKITNTVYDLKAGDYKFTTEIGTFTDRFQLKYTNKTLGTGDFENVKDGLLVSVKDKVIKVTSVKENIKEISVFDINGKLLYNKKKVESLEYTISNLQVAEQVLLVKVTLENKAEVTRKVIFK